MYRIISLAEPDRIIGNGLGNFLQAFCSSTHQSLGGDECLLMYTDVANLTDSNVDTLHFKRFRKNDKYYSLTVEKALDETISDRGLFFMKEKQNEAVVSMYYSTYFRDVPCILAFIALQSTAKIA